MTEKIESSKIHLTYLVLSKNYSEKFSTKIFAVLEMLLV